MDLVVIGGLLLYLSQPQALIPNVAPSPGHTPSSSTPPAQTPTPTPSPSPAPTSTPTPTTGEKDRVRDVLRSYFGALDRHSVNEAVSFFTDQVEILINHGENYSYKGPKEGVKQYLTMAFMLAPDARITDVNFISLDVNQNRATAQVSYLVTSKTYNLSRAATENIELVEQNNQWKIAKTDIVY